MGRGKRRGIDVHRRDRAGGVDVERDDRLAARRAFALGQGVAALDPAEVLPDDPHHLTVGERAVEDRRHRDLLVVGPWLDGAAHLAEQPGPVEIALDEGRLGAALHQLRPIAIELLVVLGRTFRAADREEQQKAGEQALHEKTPWVGLF